MFLAYARHILLAGLLAIAFTAHHSTVIADSALYGGQEMELDSYLESGNGGGMWFGCWTTNPNYWCQVFVFYGGWNPSDVWWYSGLCGQQDRSTQQHLSMQVDGNLVVYDGSYQPLWATNTDGNPGAWLNVQNDGNLVVYVDSTPIWAWPWCGA